MKHIRNRRFCGSLYSGLSVTAALSLVTLVGCQEEFDGYYNQPSWVTKTSQQVLESRSDCNTYLQLVNKTLFAKQVQGSGQYTFLVPTDDAFKSFFASNPYGYTNVDDIPEDVASRMVSSWMTYNAYPCDTLPNVLVDFNSWRQNVAFKHMTPSYDLLREETLDGVNYQVYDFYGTPQVFEVDNNSLAWNNYRYLPIYTKRFNENNSITSDDWKKVVGSEFSPYGNYLQAGIIDAGSGSINPGDLYCQNGVIHLVDKVVMPLENMDRLICTYGDGSAVDQPEESKAGAWKLLRNMLYHKQGNGEYQFLEYRESSVARHYFEKAFPQVDMSNFRIRRYKSVNSPFSLNIEKYNTMQNLASNASDLFYDEYNGGMTFYVPEKNALLDYINNRLFRFVDVKLTESSTQSEFDAAFNKMSSSVLVALWGSMQSNGMIWPSQFRSSALNSLSSSEHIDGYDESITYDNNVLSAGMASNAMWQITDFVPKTSAFEGVMSRLLLDPAFSMFETLYSAYLSKNLLKSKLSGMDDVDLTLILWDDKNAQWWDNIHFSTLLSTYATGEVGNETSVLGNVVTTMSSGYIEREKEDALDLEVDPLNGAYGGWAYTNNSNNGVMRYRKSGKTIDGQPEIQVQTMWSLCNDENERAMYETGVIPAKLQQTEPTEGSYASVVKDNSTDYINGNVYLITEHSAPLDYAKEGVFGDGKQYYYSSFSPLSYLQAYLQADAKSEHPQHTLFSKYFNYYNANKLKKNNADTITISSGANYWTIFVPTDAALQAAIDYGKTHDISLLRHPDNLPADPLLNDANWADSVIYFINTYITKSGCFPDDGLSGLYEMSEAWNKGLAGTNRQAPKQYLVTTNAKVTDVDRIGPDGKVIKCWDGLMTGANMSGYVAKTGDGNKLQYFGRPYTSGAFEVVNVYNSNEMTDSFDNTVVREAGQSNIMAPNCMIHSLNGFIVYKIAAH